MPQQSLLTTTKDRNNPHDGLRVQLIPRLTQSLSDPLQLYGGLLQVGGDTL